MSEILSHIGSAEEIMLNELGSKLELTDEERQGSSIPIREGYSRKLKLCRLTHAPLFASPPLPLSVPSSFLVSP